MEVARDSTVGASDGVEMGGPLSKDSRSSSSLPFLWGDAVGTFASLVLGLLLMLPLVVLLLVGESSTCPTDKAPVG